MPFIDCRTVTRLDLKFKSCRSNQFYSHSNTINAGENKQQIAV